MKNVKIKLTEQNEIEEVFNEDIEIPKPFIIVPSSVWQKFSIYKKDDLLITNQTISLKNNVVLEKEKKKKLLNINTLCEVAIVGGFTSSALGEEYFYYSTLEEQTTLNSLINLGFDNNFKAQKISLVEGVEVKEGRKQYPHTLAQLRQILIDGATHIKAQIDKKDLLEIQITNATTAEQVEAISWEG